MSITSTVESFKRKVEKVRKLASDKELDGIVVSSLPNFSWLTGGRGFVGLASETSCASIAITRDRILLIANNIEAGRLHDEELGGLSFDDAIYNWYDDIDIRELALQTLGIRNAAVDTELAGEFRSMRSTLDDVEIFRYKALGYEAANAVEDVCFLVRQGTTEYEIAGEVGKRLWSLGIEPITILVGSDWRLFKYRHPLPTSKSLDKYLMIAVCARRQGLYASLTRFVHFGKLPDDIKVKHSAVTKTDAAFILSTRPEMAVSDVFKLALEEYRRTGYADEWKLHHQGGLTGYMAREYRGTEKCLEIVKANQAFAWNPSISGTKSEDTIIVMEDENQILTYTGEYPYIEVVYEGKELKRPDILIR
ncbi:MAG: aminopeptidase P family N-terminal domain-containing protein [Firmicutes bacterium]|nr:aminopeptidase P family N-terminal domain-containing protein [Bacillota bacterium]